MTPHREPGVRPVLALAERVLATPTVTGTGADDDPSSRCRASDRSSRSCAQPLPPWPRARLPRYANACRQASASLGLLLLGTERKRRGAMPTASCSKAATTSYGSPGQREHGHVRQPRRTRRTDSVVVDQCVVDLASDEALQAADDVLLRQALGGASADVVDGRLVPAHADDHDPLESRVGMAVAAAVEPMPIGDAG